MKKIFLMAFIGLCFCLLAQGQTITVTSPLAGDTWFKKGTYKITWTKSGSMPATVAVRLRRAGAPESELAVVNITDSTANIGTKDWTIPDTVPVGDYFIRVRTSSPNVIGDSGIFHINGPQIISKVPPERPGPWVGLKFPRLEVSNIDLTPNADGFGIIFSYKNTGGAALPKASDVPVKPNYRVLIDGKETASGSLFIPAFAAPPGWEQTGYFGGWIVLPTVVVAQYGNWRIGSFITVHINENKAMGMESHSLTLPLKPIALKYKCDALINGVSFNWQTHMVTVSLCYEGKLQPMRRLTITCSDKDDYPVNPDFDFNFFQTVMLTEGQHYYSLSKKINFPEYKHSIILYVKAYVPLAGSAEVNKVVDMDNRNNFWKQCKFVYPDTNPVR